MNYRDDGKDGNRHKRSEAVMSILKIEEKWCCMKLHIYSQTSTPLKFGMDK